MLCRRKDYCSSISVLQSSLAVLPSCVTGRENEVCGCAFACLCVRCAHAPEERVCGCTQHCAERSFSSVAPCCVSDCSFVHWWTSIFPTAPLRKAIDNPRRTLRIYRDTKGIVVKMLITMLTAMYMMVRVVESVRHPCRM